MTVVALLVEGLVEQRLAELDVLLALAHADEAADRGLGLAGDDEALPGRRRRLRLRGDDLDLVAVGELRAQRQHAAVDLGADAGVADLAVHRIGEVDRRRAARQGDQLALGREAEHLVLEHLELGVLEELLGVGRLVEDVDQAAQPGILRRVGRRPALLVDPVRGDAALGLVLHLLGADLDLDALAERADHAGVQRAVAVRLGHRDVVLEALRQHLVAAVQQAERLVALRRRRRR